MGDVNQALTLLSSATPIMAICLALVALVFVVYAGLKIINLLGNHQLHALGELLDELKTLNHHESIEQSELAKQTISLDAIRSSLAPTER